MAFIRNQFLSVLQSGQSQPAGLSTHENYEIVNRLTPSDGYEVLPLARTDDFTEEFDECVMTQASSSPQPPTHRRSLIGDPIYYNTMYSDIHL